MKVFITLMDDESETPEIIAEYQGTPENCERFVFANGYDEPEYDVEYVS